MNRVLKLITAIFILSASCFAATLTVTKTTDTSDGVCNSDCSLREAVAAAASGDTIVFASPLFDTAQTISINGQIVIGKSLAINGRGASVTRIQNIAAASGTSRVLMITGSVTVSLFGLTITGGNLIAGTAASPCDANTACGGGIFNGGGLTLTNSVVSGNTVSGAATGYGGGIFTNRPLTLINSTVQNNVNNGNGAAGAGIAMFGNTTTIINSTVSGNTASGTSSSQGGGIHQALGTLSIINSTVTNNSSQGGAAGGLNCNGLISLINTIVSGNNAPTNPDLFGSPTSSSTNNLIGGNAGLLPLGNYGGPTPTHALSIGSPAVNAGNSCVLTPNCSGFNPPFALTTDQRGAARIGNVDIGAFEVNNSANGGTFKAVLPTGRTGTSYATTLIPTVPSGTTYAVTAGALPTGLTLGATALAGIADELTSAPQAGAGISGIPTVGGTFDFTITATDGANTTATDYQMQVFVPTSAGVAIEGRVTTANGRGIANAFVMMTDATGQVRTVKTAALGYFRFDDVAAGQTVVLNVKSRKFSFAPRVVFLSDSLTNLDLVGTP